ncbi:MAG: sigma-70 family RNA polymerase sigma factor [Verrucomicrobia bacterium]|nr:sigma-70 family RNA polymerase sigma factor [Verrucomicrobiota bacterium]
MTDDGQLLEQYAQKHFEPAFGELVARHIDLVYSAALRVVNGDKSLAEDVTQTVFMDLARKARSLPREIMLAGWLYRHTCYVASKTVRTERRRKTREQTALEMRALDDLANPAWERIAPHLDQSLNQLTAADRDAIVLRFLKRQDLRAMGATLGISEDAAQKRVGRALARLRDVLSRRGVELTAVALASALAAETVTAAPAGLAVSVTAASLAATAGTGTTLTLFEFMAASKLKAGLAGAMVLASLVTPLVVQRQAQAKLRHQDEALRQQADQLAKLHAEKQQISKRIAQGESTEMLPSDQFSELLRLRGEVGLLRKQVQELAQSQPPTPVSRSEMLASMARQYSARVSQLQQLLATSPTENIPELQFLTDSDWLWLATRHALDNEESRQRALSTIRLMGEQNFVSELLKPALQQYARDQGGQFPGDLSQLKLWFSSPVEETVLRRWEILPRGKMVQELQGQLDEDWYITQKAPVNAALDQRILVGLKNVHSFSDGPPSFWDTAP